MIGERMLRAGLVFIGIGCCSFAGCHAAPAPQVAAAPAAPSASARPLAVPPPSAEPAAAPEPAVTAEDSPGFAETLARLRPAGTEAALASLTGAPAAAEAYAQAALVYASTDAAGMTLIWGMTYQAMGGGASSGKVAEALAKVLRERIVAVPDPQTHQVKFNVRLAPGSIPVRKTADGVAHVPLAHLFEGLFSPALVGARPPWTIEQFYDALSTWVAELASRGSPLDERLELDHWLVATAKAGHLEAYCHALLGPAFPAELKQYRRENAAAFKAYEAFSKDAALRPEHAALPDDLVAMPTQP